MVVEENLFLCLLISNFAGIFTILGKAVVIVHKRAGLQKENDTDEGASAERQSYAFHEKKHKRTPSTDDDSMSLDSTSTISQNLNHNVHSSSWWKTTTCFVLANILANLCIFLAPWFGPVSIYWPTFIASQLLANMIIVGILLKQEMYRKQDQVATLVVVVAVLYINLNGPVSSQSQSSSPPDIRTLLSENTIAWIWLIIVGIVFLASFGIMLRLLILESLGCRLPWLVEAVLMLVSITCSTLSATTSKAASTLDGEDDRILRTSLMAISWLVIVCWSIENYMEGTRVRSLARFLPGVTMGSILMNTITGLLVWRDYKAIDSWIGYATALALLGLGVYLISNVDFFPGKLPAMASENLPSPSPYLEGQHQNLWSHGRLLSHLGRLQRALSQSQLELTLPRHQQALLRHSRRWAAFADCQHPKKSTSFSLGSFSGEEMEEGGIFRDKDEDEVAALLLTDLRRGISDPEWGAQGILPFRNPEISRQP